MGKIKLSAVGDAGCPTGFATVMHNVMSYLQDSGDYDINILGINYDGRPNKWSKQFTIWPARIGGDFLGVGATSDFIKQTQPDVTFLFQDFFNLPLFLGELPEGLPGITCYYPVDAPNIKGSYLLALGATVEVACYTDFAVAESVRGMKEGWTRLMHDAKKQNLDVIDTFILQARGGTDPLTGVLIGDKKVEVYARRLHQLLKKQNYNVIPHGTDLSAFHQLDQKECRKKYGIKEDIFLVGNVNRNQPRKRLDLTIRAFAQFAKDKPDAYLLLHSVRNDSGGWDLRQLASYYGLEDRVISSHKFFQDKTATIEELNEIYNTLDVQLNTGGGEGWGLCLRSDSLIPTDSGFKEIKDITVGENVLASGGTFSRVLNTTKRHVNKIYKVKVRQHESVYVTKEHPFLSFSGNGFKYPSVVDEATWKTIKELREGDFIAVGRMLPSKRKSDLIFDLSTLFSSNEGWDSNEENISHPMGYSQNQAKHSINYLSKTYGYTKKQVEKARKAFRTGYKNNIQSESVLQCLGRYKIGEIDLTEPIVYNRFVTLSEDMLYVLGWYLAEGSSDKNSIEFSMSSLEMGYAERILDIIEKTFNVKGKITIEDGKNKNTKLRISISGQPVARFFEFFCGSGARNKRLHSLIKLSDKKVLNVWRGYILGDGSRGMKSCTACSVSRVLMHQLQLSFKSFGASVGINYYENRNVYVAYLGIEATNLLFGTKNKNRTKVLLYENNQLWGRIQSIEKIDTDEKVYDLHIENTHSFVANGVIVHNTSFEGAASYIPQVVPDWSATKEIWAGYGELIKIAGVLHNTSSINLMHCVIDCDDLCRILNEMYEDKEHRKRVGEACYQVTQRQEYRWENVGKKFDTMFKRAAGKTPIAGGISVVTKQTPKVGNRAKGKAVR